MYKKTLQFNHLFININEKPCSGGDSAIKTYFDWQAVLLQRMSLEHEG